jgi:hypothetical protein
LKQKNLNKQDIDNGKYKDMFYYQRYLDINNNVSNLVKSLTDEETKLFGEYIKRSAFKNLYSSNLDLFKQRLVVNFKKSAEETMYKMRKLTYDYLSDNDLMENEQRSIDKEKMLKLMGIDKFKDSSK